MPWTCNIPVIAVSLATDATFLPGAWASIIFFSSQSFLAFDLTCFVAAVLHFRFCAQGNTLHSKALTVMNNPYSTFSTGGGRLKTYLGGWGGGQSMTLHVRWKKYCGITISIAMTYNLSSCAVTY